MTDALAYIEGATLPNAVITPADDDGNVVDLTGAELVLRVGSTRSRAFEMTTGLTVNGDLTVEVDWTADDLGTLTPGVYSVELVATTDSELRKFAGQLRITSTIAAA